MQIEFSNPEELARFTEKLITVVGHERYWTRRWMAHFGSRNRTAMDNYQAKTDAIIRDLQIDDSDLNNNIKIVLKPKTHESSNQ